MAVAGSTVTMPQGQTLFLLNRVAHKTISELKTESQPTDHETKPNAAGNDLVYSSYLGGSTLEYGFGVAVDSSGAAYISGQTWSADFRTASPFQASRRGYSDAFITKIVQLPVQLIDVVSRKTHAGAGTFDVNLPWPVALGLNAAAAGRAAITR